MGTPAKSNLFFLMLIFYQIVLAAIFALTGDIVNILTGPEAIIISQIFSFLPPLVICLFISENGPGSIIPLKKPSFSNIIIVVLICIVIQPAMMLMSAISSFLFPNEISDIVSEMTVYPYALTISAIALMPAVLEEIMFRGIVLSGYQNIDIKKAAFINGLFFGIIHMDPQQFLYAFALGCVFTYFVHRTGSLLYSVLGHFVINSTQTALAYLQSIETSIEMNAVAQTADITEAILGVAILTAVCLPFLILLFILFERHNKMQITTNIHAELVYTKQKVFNWAFWVIIILYIIIISPQLFDLIIVS